MAYDEGTHLPVRAELDDPTSGPLQPRIYVHVHDQIPPNGTLNGSSLALLRRKFPSKNHLSQSKSTQVVKIPNLWQVKISLKLICPSHKVFDGDPAHYRDACI